MAFVSSSAAARDPSPGHAAINRKLYATRGVYRSYLSEVLEPSEAASLLRYQPCFAGKDVLDIGVGAGRTTRYLAPLAHRYEAIDYSPDMIGYMRQAMPEISAQLADFRELSPFQDATFDFVFATNNVLDNFSNEDRLRALEQARRVLRPGGMIVLSSHNLRFAGALSGPSMEWSRHPVQLARNLVTFLSSVRNHARVRRLREIHPEYAILNDCGHRFAILHYYATPETMRSQLQTCGFRLLATFDKQGRLLAPTADTSHSSSLTYAAERLP